ncbi:putative NEDD8-activating enzyme E1 regulatory [Trypoxylus dichotomus]
MSSPAPKSPEQSEKSKKYDRQLRLWGDHGQKLLENAKVCLINATALGTEILKSLVLPGIGAFTIVDGEKVTEQDIGSNFFLENDSVGLSRAKVATSCLLELNPDVHGDYIDESPEHIMAHTQAFFNNFSVVIATSLPEKILLPLSKQLWEANVPLIVGRKVHPDNENPDLRLEDPWPSLKDHLNNIDILKLDKKERSHVPALAILYYYLEKFKKDHGGIPITQFEKDILRNLIKGGNCFGEEDEDGNTEENFQEAIHYVNTCIGQFKVPPQIQALLDDDRCTNLTQESSSFWVMCAALRELVQNEGSLPVRGSLPDMAADTVNYVALQQLYQKQAQLQAEAIYRRALQIARNLGQAPDTISEQEVKLFCKHASELYVASGSCIADEYQSTAFDISSYLEDPDSLMLYYAIIRGLERFISEFNTNPGQFDDQVEPDVLKLKGIIGKLLAEWGCGQAIRDERIHEICRYGGAELHSVSAMLGGCAAHEIIKLITHQYKPLNNTFIYDAITTNSATFVL